MLTPSFPQSFGAVIQARTSSTRLPGKVFLPIGKWSVLQWVTMRLHTLLPKERILLATTTNSADDRIAQWCRNEGFPCFRGDEENLLKRFIDAGKEHNIPFILRICSDSPLLDIDALPAFVRFHTEGHYDLSCYHGVPGAGMELFSLALLERVEPYADKQAYKEHVTPYVYHHPTQFSIGTFRGIQNRGDIPVRLTIDEPADIKMMNALWETAEKEGIKSPAHFSTEKAVELLSVHPETAALNAGVKQKQWQEELKAEEEKA